MFDNRLISFLFSGNGTFTRVMIIDILKFVDQSSMSVFF